MKIRTFNASKTAGKIIYTISESSHRNEGTLLRFYNDNIDNIMPMLMEASRAMPHIEMESFSFAITARRINGGRIPVLELKPEIPSGGKYPVMYGLENNSLRGKANRLRFIGESLAEIRMIIDKYLKYPKVDFSRAGVAGISVGGTLALLAAYLDRRIKVSAPFLPITGFENLAGDVNDKISEKKIESIRRLDPLFVYKENPGTAFIIQYGGSDKFTELPRLNALHWFGNYI